MPYKLFTVVFLMVTVQGISQNLNAFFDEADAFFKANVSNGMVAYSKIHANPEALIEVLKIAETVSVAKEDANAYQAFWINAYNLSVIKGVVDNYPTKSVLNHKGFFDKTTYNLAGLSITLNDIENKLLRTQFNDPRIHFELVCGAIGCPPIINEAYLPETLNSQMDKQTKLALNGSFVKINHKKKRIEVSQIMEWYKNDFIKNGKTEIDFINQYRTTPIPNNFKLSYFPYNWELNQQ